MVADETQADIGLPLVGVVERAGRRVLADAAQELALRTAAGVRRRKRPMRRTALPAHLTGKTRS